MLNILSHLGNANQNTMRLRITLLRMSKIKSASDSSCLQGCREKGTLLHYWWECKLVQSVWKSIWKVLRKFGVDLPRGTVIPLLGIYPKNVPSCNKNACLTTFISVSS